jgi:hypothetical protein
MSHIDSFAHEIVGLFGGLPVYHPLQAIRGDFVCDERHLLIGGGSGEHPALVIDDPTGAVALFLHDELAALNPTYSLRVEPRLAYRDAWLEVVTPHVPAAPGDVLTYSEWTDDTHRRFRARCTSPAMPCPLREDRFERDLVLGIGEFVFFALPTLAPAILDALDDPYADFKHVQHNNILLVPPNMPVYANGGNAFHSVRTPR